MAVAEDLVLVTGASGFIAGHVIQQLLEQGYKVRGTVRSLNEHNKIDPIRKVFPPEKLELAEGNLLDLNCWVNAVRGCKYVIHIASPVTISTADEDTVIRPAVEGTLNVLRASKRSGTVKRVVLTSSMDAMKYSPNPENRVFTESDWSDISYPSIFAYTKSKVLAEKAAWEFINGQEGNGKMELSVIIPTLVGGPLLTGVENSPSLVLPLNLLTGAAPFLPHTGLPVCDVRDVAKAHIRAMTVPEAAGHRIIVTSGSLWLKEIAEIVKKEFEPQGYSVSTWVAPNFVMWILSFFVDEIRRVYDFLNIIQKFDRSKLDILGITPVSVEEAILSSCYSLIDHGRIPKTQAYTGRNE